jgi:hypothetical protein
LAVSWRAAQGARTFTFTFTFTFTLWRWAAGAAGHQYIQPQIICNLVFLVTFIHQLSTMPPKAIAPAPPPQTPRNPTAPQAAVLWSTKELIPNLGGDVAAYNKYEVPWNGGVTVGDWMHRYHRVPAHEQKRMVDDWLGSLTEYLDLTSNVVTAAASSFIRNQDLMRLYGGERAFLEQYPVVRDIKSYQEKHQQETINAFALIRKYEQKLLEEVLHPYSAAVVTSHTGATTIAYILRRFPIELVVPFLNTAYYRRRNKTNTGKQAFISNSDWTATKEVLRAFGPGANNLMGLDKAKREQALKFGVSPNDLKDLDVRASKPEQQEFYKYLLKEYGASSPTGKPEDNRVIDIPKQWLIDRHLERDSRFGLIVPFIAALGSNPRIETRRQGVVDNQAEGSSLTIGERPVLIDPDHDTVMRTPDSAKMTGILRRRSGSISQRASPGSPRSPGSQAPSDPEEERLLGNQEYVLRKEKLEQLKRSKPRLAGDKPPPPTRLTRQTQVPAPPESVSAYEESLDAEETIDEGIDPKAAHTAATGRSCRCANQSSVLVSMLKGLSTKSRKLEDRQRIKLIDEWYRETLTTGSYDGTRVCYNHTQFLSGKMGIKTRNADMQYLRELLLLLYFSKDRWGELQSDVVTGSLFLAPFRGTHQHSDLKSYRYRPAPIHVSINWKEVGVTMGWESYLRDFQEYGTVNLPCFEWVLEDKELVEILDQSYRMYEYHCRQIDGNSNLGWCRTMYHSLIQQLVRGDPLYWLYYAVIRQEPYLISYPYYTKFTHPGDHTYFRHIDLNIADAVRTGNGISMIQGSVSWNEEDSKNCTQMLTGFHAIINEYQALREQSSMKDSTGYIQLWKDGDDFPPQCKQQFPKVKWTDQICKAGQVRISSPLLPHGSTGPATKERRTMLPWFVRVHRDMKTMEVPEMGSYADIATAHQQLTAAPTSPSGHPNRYGGVNWAFPADVNPVFSSPISRAVNCQLRWDSPLVQEELVNLFGRMDYEHIEGWIKRTREATTKMVKAHWKIAKRQEERAFGADTERGIPSRSFFENKGRNPPQTAEWWVYDGQVTQATAMDRLRDQISVTQEERSVADAAGRSRSASVSRGSPMSPRTPGRGGLSMDALVLQTPTVREEEEDNATPMASPSRAPQDGSSLGSPRPRRSERLKR